MVQWKFSQRPRQAAKVESLTGYRDGDGDLKLMEREVKLLMVAYWDIHLGCILKPVVKSGKKTIYLSLNW